MSTHQQTIERIVLLNIKPDVDKTKVTNIIDEINGLASLDLIVHLSVGKLLRSTSSSLNFSHIIHSHYKSTDDLQAFNHHPEHLRVGKNMQEIVDDSMLVDCVSGYISHDLLTPGYVMRVMLLKLKEGLDENEKDKLMVGVKSLFKTDEPTTVSENLSPETGKGYSIAMIVVFPSLEAIDSDAELENLYNSKLNELIDDKIVVDYVAP
ncbi:hypothetical protein QVD17_17409 [Tagetes erecta]|uniref:Stress-response A/B barrel domain-containing protein n=1 Tax=Tagetes erecta TaxID=13708 RepID=A0AAD8KWS6_TARER|nr:hypothetical protein QVD17_17409 [Tagetes erecta]